MKSRSFKLVSGGAAYNLIVGFAPSKVRILNKTKFATDNTNVEFQWSEGMPNGYAYARKTGDGEVNSAIITSNGVTRYDASNFATNKYTITGISAATQAVVTATNSASVGDWVYISGVVGMVEINDAHYQVVAAGASSFTIDVDSSAFTAYSSGGVAQNVSAVQSDAGGVGVTLGTSVIGADGDELEVYCELDDMAFENLGDIG